jgi:thioredoxin reductase
LRSDRRWCRAGRTDGTFQTSVKGVFGAGDVRAGATLQAAAAAGEGVIAALMIRDYLRQ